MTSSGLYWATSAGALDCQICNDDYDEDNEDDENDECDFDDDDENDDCNNDDEWSSLGKVSRCTAAIIIEEISSRATRI